jgi:uncharacterized protein (TIGR03067 family)
MATTDGTWKPVSVELGGQPLPDEVLQTMELMLEGNSYVMRAGEQLDRGTIALDEETLPLRMDIAGTRGPNAGKHIPAIWRLDGDLLTICYGLEGESRPFSFATGANPKLFLVKYRRSPSHSEAHSGEP